jgi:hypothetical protein
MKQHILSCWKATLDGNFRQAQVTRRARVDRNRSRRDFSRNSEPFILILTAWAAARVALKRTLAALYPVDS